MIFLGWGMRGRGVMKLLKFWAAIATIDYFWGYF